MYMSHRRRVLLGAVVGSTVLAVTLTGCNSDSGGGKSGRKSSSSHSDSDSDSGDKKDAQAGSRNSGPLRLGQTAPGLHTYDMSDGKAKLQIAAQKVNVGKNTDLTDAGLRASDVKGMYPVFVHVKYTVKEAKGLDDPGFNRKMAVMGTGKTPAKRLMAIGGDPIKGGCPEDQEFEWKVGDSNTMCSTFLMPEGKKPVQVAWAGDMRNPLIWNVK